MIQYVKRKELDVSKYDFCIENSVQSRIYAFSWYLDIVADHWDVLVLDDYHAVMPIPWRKKYGIKYVTQPHFCQQLGVFSLDEISIDTQQNFIKKIPKKFLKVSLQLNSDSFIDTSFLNRKNYVLPLNDSYENLFKGFNKGRKHAVKVGEKNDLIIKDVIIENLIQVKKEFYKSAFLDCQERKLKELSKIIIKKEKGFCIGVFDKDSFLGGAFFLKTENRLIYLFSGFNIAGKSKQASSFLINNILKKYEMSNLLLDFEGSSIPNIGSFFKSFGSKVVHYYVLYYSSSSIFLSFFKKNNVKNK